MIKTPRLMQMSGMFDVALSDKSQETWRVDLDLPEQWNVGLIVAPSGGGKTTVARELFGDALIESWDWPVDKSVLDGFPIDMSIKEIVDLLSSVGFSSPPSWVRPFRVLSNGEQFRVNMARTLAEMPALAVVDEFTSVIDRTVAQIGSAAIQKTVRKRDQKFIAVSCHYDIIDWLEPDWIYQPHLNDLIVGRSLHQRPKVTLEIKQVHSSAWQLFSKHHYLDHSLNTSAQCFIGFIDQSPVVFCAMLSFPHATRSGWRVSRLVTLPDYQGIGIGAKMLDFIAAYFRREKQKPVFITTSHPAFVHSLARSKNWKMNRQSSRTANAGSSSSTKMYATLANRRLTCGFEYIG